MFWFDTSHLTVDGQRNLLLSGSYARDHGAANVFPSVLLPHGLQCQEVLVAKNLRREKKEVRRSQRSLDAMTAEAPSHSRYQQSNAEVVGKKKEDEKKQTPGAFYTLKGNSTQLLKSNLGSGLGGERECLALPFNVDKRKRWNESEFGMARANLTTGGGYGKGCNVFSILGFNRRFFISKIHTCS